MLLWPWVEGALAAYEDSQHIFLQDAALLQQHFKESELWKHRVFQTPLWPAFAAKVRELAIHGVLPLVADSMTEVSNKVSSVAIKQDRMHAVVESLLAGQSELTAALRALPQTNAQALRQILAPQLEQLGALILAQPRSFMTVPTEAVKLDWLLAESSRQQRAAPAGANGGETALSQQPPPLPPPPPPPPSSPGSSALPSSAPSAVASSPPPLPAGCPPGCPADPVSPSCPNAEGVLREWFLDVVAEGVNQPSLHELDRCFGSRWRYSGALRQRYYIRSKIVRWLRGKAEERGEDLWEVARTVDRGGLSGKQNGSHPSL
ncbi:hypothetical protein MMC14_006714 [Varicellaria rhodocarpa]|nr:hypothetical protein [Varicellaria rhodocarpa]